MTNQFKIGDRVHFKETSTKLGVVVKINSQGKIGVKWDEGDPHEKTISFYSKFYLIQCNQNKRSRGNPNFNSRKTNPAVVKSNNHPVFPGIACEKSATVQIPTKVKNLVCKADGTGLDENLYRKIQFLIRKHALKVSGCASWEELKNQGID